MFFPGFDTAASIRLLHAITHALTCYRHAAAGLNHVPDHVHGEAARMVHAFITMRSPTHMQSSRKPMMFR